MCPSTLSGLGIQSAVCVEGSLCMCLMAWFEFDLAVLCYFPFSVSLLSLSQPHLVPLVAAGITVLSCFTSALRLIPDCKHHTDA